MSGGNIGARLIIWQNNCTGFYCLPSFGLLSKRSDFSPVPFGWNRRTMWSTVFYHSAFFHALLSCMCLCRTWATDPWGVNALVQRGPGVLQHECSAFPSDCWVDAQGNLVAERTWCFCGSFCSLTLVRRDMGEDEDKKNWEAGIDKSLKVPGQVAGWGESLEYLQQKLTFKTIYKTEFIHS